MARAQCYRRRAARSSPGDLFRVTAEFPDESTSTATQRIFPTTAQLCSLMQRQADQKDRAYGDRDQTLTAGPTRVIFFASARPQVAQTRLRTRGR